MLRVLSSPQHNIKYLYTFILLGKKLEMLELEKKFLIGDYTPFQEPVPGQLMKYIIAPIP